MQVRSLGTDGDAGETRALGELPGLTAAIWPGSLPAIVVPSPAPTVSTTSTTPPVDPVRPDGNVVVPAAPRFRPVAEAVTRFESAGLAVEIERLAPGSDDTDEVIWQEPPAGTIRPPGSIVRLWTCGPGASCVVPPPAYADGYEPATDWRPVDLASAQWRAIRDLAADDQEGLRAAVLAMMREGFRGPETISMTFADGNPDGGHFWVQWRNSEDDSIDGQDLRWWVERDAAGYRVVRGEVREVCNRGEAVTDLCP